jgi:Fe-S oxidoreductase
MALVDDGVITLSKLAAEHKAWFKPLPHVLGPMRYLDPCQLGRGLGQYAEPRLVLEQILGAPPEEFVHVREHAACSGAGAIVPLTMPQVSARIAEQRIEEHEQLGGGTIVTACASSLVRFRKSGAPAIDLATLMRKSLLGDD